jgi:hypothetical protein
MSLSTYADLKSAIATWVNRSDLTSVIPDFVVLTESDLRNDVRVQAMEQFASGTLTGETLAHPSRFIFARRLVVGGVPFNYVSVERYQDLSYARAEDRVFTSIGQNLYILNGQAGDDYSLIYTQAFAALSADGDTNWLLTYAPDVYLFGACKHAATYLASQTDEVRFTSLYNAAVARVSRQEQRAAYGGPLMVRAA